MATRRAKKKANEGAGSDTGARLGFETQLWAAADALRNNMDAAEYNGVGKDLVIVLQG